MLIMMSKVVVCFKKGRNCVQGKNDLLNSVSVTHGRSTVKQLSRKIIKIIREKRCVIFLGVKSKYCLL